jgi:hypothetical protein
MPRNSMRLSVHASRSHAAPRSVSARQLAQWRTRTFRLATRLRLRNERDAVRFVNERGFVYFWPIKGVDLPSLWVAAAGERPVADAHDDPGHATWGWKDRLLGERQWYYAKILRGKATMISLETAKYFYALSENYGDPEADYLLQFEAGALSLEAKTIYETLLEKGALDTVALRREARMTARESNARFERALTELQTDFKILPIGVAKAGAWRYAFIYELASRWYPELPAEARRVGRGEARQHLIDLYLQSVGAATEAKIAFLFRWRPADVSRACADLVGAGRAWRPAEVGRQAGEWLATAELG